MKRGNTALKRGVGLASAFALAIAGAVIAAPAANAAPGAADYIRVIPTADAAYVGADGSAGAFTGASVYSATSPTGTARVVKPSATQQALNDFQVVVPAGTTSGNLTVTLTDSAGAAVNWAAPPAVDVDSTERVLASFATSAGFEGTNAHKAQAVTSGADLPSGAVGPATIATNVATVALSGVPASPAGGYLLTFHGVTADTTAATGAITAALSISGTASGATPLAYSVSASVAVAQATVEADGNSPTNDVTLPDITVTESAAGALTIAGDLTLTIKVNGTAASVVTPNTDAKAVAAGGGLAVASAVNVTANPIVVDVSSASAATPGTVTISGIKLSGVAKNGEVTVEVTTPTTGVTAVNEKAAKGSGTPSEFAFSPTLSAATATIATTVPQPRIAGADRYATAAKVLDLGLGAQWSTTTTTSVVIANGENAKQGVDALAANYLAGAKNAPILLTAANSLPVATQTALIKLFKGNSGAADVTVYVMGKTDSVSQAVRDQISALITNAVPTWSAGKSVKVVEVAGDNRYSTSAAAATTAGTANLKLVSLTTGTAWLRTAFLASGTNNADALAAGSVSVAGGIPVLLTNGKTLDDKVKAALSSLGIQQVIVLGGTDRVSDALVASLSGAGVTSTKRIAEADRFQTAAAIYAWAFAAVNPSGTETNRGLGWTTTVSHKVAYIANGASGFADALAVGPLAGAYKNPILTTSGDKLVDAATKVLKDNKAQFTDGIWALGQQDRVSADVITAAEAAIK